MIEYKKVMEHLSEIVTIGTITHWCYIAIKKLYKIFFPPGKHVRK